MEMYSKIQGHGILFFDLDVVYFLLLLLFDIVVRCHYIIIVYRAVIVHRNHEYLWTYVCMTAVCDCIWVAVSVHFYCYYHCHKSNAFNKDLSVYFNPQTERILLLHFSLSIFLEFSSVRCCHCNIVDVEKWLNVLAVIRYIERERVFDFNVETI